MPLRFNVQKVTWGHCKSAHSDLVSLGGMVETVFLDL